MAKLEFEFIGIDQNFRSSASNVLKDIDKIKSAFRDVGKGVSGDALKAVLGAQKVALAEAKVEAVKLAQTHNNELATALNDSKKGFIDAKTAIQEYNLEQKKLKDTQRTNSQGAYSNLSKELNQMRNEAKNLGAQMILLDKAGMSSSVTFNTLKNRFDSTQKEVLELDQAIKKLDSSVGQNNRRVGAYGNALGGYQQAQSGANGVTMEFNRIIQDAPFGMMGVGNNIQQLAENWKVYTAQAKAAAVANGTTVTTMGLVKGALAGIFSPLNLLSLGISAVTSGWILYEKWQQKANKATKDNRSEMDKLKDSMSNYNQVLAENEAKGQNEITRLNRLMAVYKDVNQSQKNRKGAYEDMISLYETYFGKLSKEERKTFDLAKAYDKLSVSILKTAKARAFDELIQQNEKDIILLEKSLIDSGNKIIGATNKVGEQYRKNRVKSSEDASKQGINPRNIYEIKQAEDALNKSAEEGNKLATRKNTLLRENESYEKKILALGLEGAKITDSTGDTIKERETSTSNTTKNLKEAYDYLSKIRDLISGKQKDIDLINVDGQAKDLIELEYKWEDYFNKIADLNNKLQKDIKKGSISSIEAEKVKEGLRIASGMGDELLLSEQSEILKKYQDIRLEIIRKANEEAGIFEQQSRETDLAKQKIWLDEKLKELVKNGANIKQAMEDMIPADLMRTYNINIKWDDKDLEEWGKLNDKIQETIDKPFSSQNPKSIQAELEKRIGILKKLLEQLAKATGQPFDQAEFDKMSKEMEDNAKKQRENKQLEKDIQDYVTIANNGLNSVFTNLKANIDEFGLKARSVFYTLGESLGDLIKQLANKNTAKFMQQLTDGAKDFKGLADNFSNMWKNDKGQVIGAGLGMAGSLTSSLGGGWDIVGSGLSGAASGLAAGAATGMAGGGVYGAAIGAVVGMTAGILKQAKNRRQEKILIKQMEEQKKANRLLERMSALTYASQIIGQKTEYGIVSGMKRNEYGQIVSVVQGQDIIMVADRANNGKNR